MDRFGVDLRAEGEAGQDGELVGGVEAVDVEGRVGFGIAEALGVRQAGLEGQPLHLHAGEDVVAGAVEDAVDAGDLVAGERLAQRLDDRDAAGDGGLEGERHARLLGRPRKRDAMIGEQGLVGGDDRLAGRQRGLDSVLGRPVRAADELDARQSISGERASATGSSNQSTRRDRCRGRGCDLAPTPRKARSPARRCARAPCAASPECAPRRSRQSRGRQGRREEERSVEA